jgi:aspartokinase-like uncharacterized kinase
MNKKFIAFVESFSTKFPNEVAAIKSAYVTCFEGISANQDNESVIPDASPEQLEKFKRTVDEVVPKQIEAKKTINQTNETLKTVKDDIESEIKSNDRIA